MALPLNKLKVVEPDGPTLRALRGAPTDSPPESLLTRMNRVKLFSGRGVTLDDLVLLVQNLVLMLQNGTGLVPAIAAMASQAERPVLGQILTGVRDQLEGGAVLSDCLARHPKAFDSMFIAAVRAGEASGVLVESLTRLSGMLDVRRQLRVRLREALTYPAVVTAVMGVVVVFMLVYMVPKFGEIFSDMWDELPLSTKFMLRSATLLRSRWWAVLPTLLAIGTGVRWLLRHPRATALWDRAKLVLPVTGRFYGTAYLYQIFASLGMLLGSRVPHLEAIAIVRQSVRAPRFEGFFDSLSDHVEAGRGMSRAFTEATFLPEPVKLTVSTGESAGALDTVMVRLGERYREDLEGDIRRLATVIEPIMLVVMGVMVGIIAVSFILPMFKLSRAMH